VTVVLGGPASSSRASRIDDPGRLLRVWALLNAASRELHEAAIPPAAVAVLARQLWADVGELHRSLSAELAGELDRLIVADGGAAPTADELRIEYATLLGWTGGLVVAMLDQLEQGGLAATAARAGPEDGGRSGPAGR
jgi:hypothetical protein